uniref:cytochrome P450 2C29-like n=1 Tax=Euleptes europaea TaxID=460621 RepID=UPI002542319B|nr:cytochrome P450 2C29-like [Euleptes europaea]
MLGLSGFLAATLAFLLVWQYLKLRWLSRQYPPGPTPLPIIGGLWRLDFRMKQEMFTKIAKDYGNIFTLWVGHKPMVILNGYQAVKEAMYTHGEQLTGRPITPFVAATMKGRGILFASGHTWKQQRRFSMMTLRNLGLGKKSMEYQIQQEGQHLVESFVSEKGKPMDPTFFITCSVSNVISAVLFGHRFSYDDKTFQSLVQAIGFMFRFMPSPFRIAYDIFPRLMSYLPGPHQKAFGCLEFGHSKAKEEITNHKETRDPLDPQDFIDYYLDQIEKTKDDPNSTFDEDTLRQLIIDFFAAGTETSTTTLRWALLYMVAYPDVQEKLQKEIHTVLGPSHVICYEDRKKLPYSNAVLHEVQRYSNILLVGSFRECVEDINLLGYHIKKGTVVIPEVSSAMCDPEQWETPFQFNPNHFLDKDGHFFAREAYLPFSAGPRVCLGERIARTELFIFFTNIMRSFKIQLPEGVKHANTDPIYGGLVLLPRPYKICAVPY